MEKVNAVITGIGGYVPDYVLTNEELSNMVDTNDEWIMTRIGVKERRILNEESKGLINPDEDKSRLKTAGENLYESTPLTYAEKGKDFQVEEDGIVVIKLKVKDDCEN